MIKTLKVSATASCMALVACAAPLDKPIEKSSVALVEQVQSPLVVARIPKKVVVEAPKRKEEARPKLIAQKTMVFAGDNADKKVATRQFTLRRGSLKKNLVRMVESYGWKLGNWQADHYRIDSPFTFKMKSLQEDLGFLLDQYPIQAQMIKANQTVQFIKVSKAGRK